MLLGPASILLGHVINMALGERAARFISLATSLGFVSAFLLLAEVPLNVLIVNKVPYTEIDWRAYMQEVEGVVNGTRDYYQLQGDTGPLVYPAGFVYIYTVLYHVTEQGALIGRAQYIFAVLYLINLALVFNIYRKTAKVPWYILAMMSLLAYRVHSIFVLRMFNDPVAMVILYASVNAMLYNKWTLASTLYSLAVSVKMNVLLFAPGLLAVLLVVGGVRWAGMQIAWCASIQLVLGAPFLLAHPMAYIHRSFELQRQFLYRWTVNWRFLPETVFLNRIFHLTLLGGHLAVLALFVVKWLRGRKVLWDRPSPSHLSSTDIVFILFTSNFVGVAFARSLHYQFYIWYYHTLPFLIWSTDLPTLLKVALPVVVEWCWNTYPSTPTSSASLHLVHLALMAALMIRPQQTLQTEHKEK